MNAFSEIIVMANLYTLSFPVTTFDNQELLPEGTLLTDEVLADLRARGKELNVKNYPFFSYGTLKKDILEYLSQEPYLNIFSDKEQTKNNLEIMGKVSVIEPVLESLAYFKEHDFYTYRHMLLVFMLSVHLSHDFNGKKSDMVIGALASPSHDFGKICIPLSILKKSNSLTLSERFLLRHHALAGFVLLNYYMHDFSEVAAKIARDHHETCNSLGYPQGINLDDRMIEIVVVSDIYDALISPRPYRSESYNNRSALEIISEKAERGEIGWDVVKALIANNRKTKHHYSHCVVSTDKRKIHPSSNKYGVIDNG
jgi:HD-GYP domain-containing protein (c-di-GMP phosphodiesterase class II)